MGPGGADGQSFGSGLGGLGSGGFAPSGNIINTLDGTTQNSGLEPHHSDQQMKYDVGGASDAGSHGNSDDTSVTDSGTDSDVGNTTFSGDASDGESQGDGTGQVDGDTTQGNSYSILRGVSLETPAQQAAQELKGVVALHQDNGPHDVLKDAAAKVEATVHVAPPLVHGVTLDEGHHFADFIKAAQTPVQSGLMATLQPSGADAVHHLDANSTTHDLGLHSADDLHAVVAAHAAPVVHDAVEHISAPVSVESLWHH
jgi:hypothetical protein